MSVFRLSGRVESVAERSGEKNGRAWSMHSARIRVNDFVVTEATIPDGKTGDYREGQDVDVIVDVTAGGSFVRAQIIGDWPKPAAALHAARAAS